MNYILLYTWCKCRWVYKCREINIKGNKLVTRSDVKYISVQVRMSKLILKKLS